MATDRSALILVADDDPAFLGLMVRAMTQDGHRVIQAADGEEALVQVERERPDLVLTDLQMPKLDGLQVCERLKRDPRTRLIPVVLYTGVDEQDPRLRAREFDADDYVIKGSGTRELRARVRSLLRLKRYTDELENAAAVLSMVAGLVERRDFKVSEHCKEVAILCRLLGESLGLPADALERLRLGAAFHDIGKIVIEDAILQKQGPLDEAERAKMMTHAAVGGELVEPMHTLAPIVPLIRHHHERLDGTGYPDGLKGPQISQEVRVLTVADIYQALVTARPYKAAFSPERAVEILRTESAKGWWDSTVVEALAGLVESGAIKQALADAVQRKNGQAS